jgi:Tfp pilus assembly protein FimT
VVRKAGAFTLIEIVISIFVLMMLLMLSIPSVTGVMADRRLRRTLDGFNGLVQQAQERSITERRAYLVVWNEKDIEVRPEVLLKDDDPNPVAQLDVAKGESWKLVLSAALLKEPPAEWIFWPSGTCEPAEVTFAGRNGSWTASYSPLTARPQVTGYAAR